MRQRITATCDTKLVAFPIQSRDLENSDLLNPTYEVYSGLTIEPQIIFFWEGQHNKATIDSDDYLWIDLVSPIKGRQSWFAYAPHWNVVHSDVKEQHLVVLTDREKDELAQVDPTELDDDELQARYGPPLDIKGMAEPVRMNEPITYVEGKPVHFTWAEATKNGRRLPVSPTDTHNIIKAAQMMERFRDVFGEPIIVTSWYRDPESNQKVGGASNSFHMTGLAVDWCPLSGITPANWQKACRTHEEGGIACGPSYFHSDIGPTRFWSYEGTPEYGLKRY